MRKSFSTIVAIAAALILTAACTTDNMGSRQMWGTGIGAAAGGLAGAQFGSGRGQLIGTALGVVGGAILGNQIGRTMDQVDDLRSRQATYNAVQNQPDGQPASWQNPNNGNYGSVTPTRTYEYPNGNVCRDYQSSIVIDGQLTAMNGRACRDPQTGQWNAR